MITHCRNVWGKEYQDTAIPHVNRPRLLFCVHMTGGQPSRGTEVTTIRFQNGMGSAESDSTVSPLDAFMLKKTPSIRGDEFDKYVLGNAVLLGQPVAASMAVDTSPKLRFEASTDKLVRKCRERNLCFGWFSGPSTGSMPNEPSRPNKERTSILVALRFSLGRTIPHSKLFANSLLILFQYLQQRSDLAIPTPASTPGHRRCRRHDTSWRCRRRQGFPNRVI